MTTNESTPTSSWTLDRLGRFVSHLEERMAFDAWLMGKTLVLAKERCKKDGVLFTDWKKEHLTISDSTVSRYVQVFVSHSENESSERLKQLTLSEAYEQSGCDPHKARKQKVVEKEKTDEKEKSRREPKPTPPANEEGETPSWATPEEPDDDVDPADDNMDDMWSRSDSIKETLRKDLPWQVKELTDKVVSLVTEDVDELKVARPESKQEQMEIATNIEVLIDKLPQLLATLPCSQELQSAI